MLSLPPKFGTYGKIEKEQSEAEIEKALAKLRWEHQRKENNDEHELPATDTKWKDRKEHTMNFQYFRPTYVPFNRRIIAPAPLDDHTEI